MTFYRYCTIRYESGPTILLDKFKMVKETPCGWWIEPKSDFWNMRGKKRWVSKTARKRFAYPTKEEALVNFKARKRRQIGILKAQLFGAETEQRLADDIVLKREN